MKTTLKRMIALMLAIITLTFAFASCAETAGGEDTTAAVSATTTATAEGSEAAVDTTPQTDEWGRPYVEAPTAEGTKLEDGTVITVLLRDSDTWNREFHSESENGDMLNDEIYKRNLKLQEDLNFTFEFIKSPTKEDSQRTIIAEFESGGSSGLDIVSNYAYYSTNASLRDCYVNLHNIDTLNLDNPWWNQTYVEAATIKDQLYFVVGDLNLSVVDRSLAMYYNATLANDYQLGNLYDTVLNGEWTIDKMYEMLKNIELTHGTVKSYDPAVGDPDNGIAPGTPFEELPDDWTCPLCGVGKELFEKA